MATVDPWAATVTPAPPPPEAGPYTPPWYHRIAQLFMGDSVSPERARLISGILGSDGSQNRMSLMDFTPAGIVKAGQEMQADAGHGDALGAGLNAMAVIPGAKPVSSAAKAALAEVMARAEATSAKRALPQVTDSTLRAKNVSRETAESLPLVREGDNLSPRDAQYQESRARLLAALTAEPEPAKAAPLNHARAAWRTPVDPATRVRDPVSAMRGAIDGGAAMRGKFYDEELAPNVMRPDPNGVTPARPVPSSQPGMQRVWDQATDTYTFRPTQPVEGMPSVPQYRTNESLPMSRQAQERLGRPKDAEPGQVFAARMRHHSSLRDFQLEPTMPNPWPGPSISQGTAPQRGSVWMINGKGEVRNSLELPGRVVDDSGKVTRTPDGWHTLYEAPTQGKRPYLTPEEMKASRELWGNPTGSLWDKAWMPTEAPQGVKDAVKEMATTGKTWGDILADTIERMHSAGMPSEEIRDQMPFIAQAVSRQLSVMHEPSQQLSMDFGAAR